MRKLILAAFLLSPSLSYAEEKVPIPKKRPAVLSVSPSFIEELRNRGKSSVSVPTPEMYIGEIANLEPASGAAIISRDIKKQTNAQKQHTLDIAALLNHKTDAPNSQNIIKTNVSQVPIPNHKPEGEKAKTTHSSNTEEQRLVSFSLPPNQIKLDKNLEIFLKNHALDLFSNNKNLKLDIQAYATTDEDTQSANIRVALARALEVRKFLLSNNIEPSRIKLTPLGQVTNNNNDDRIDLVFIDISKETL